MSGFFGYNNPGSLKINLRAKEKSIESFVNQKKNVLLQAKREKPLVN